MPEFQGMLLNAVIETLEERGANQERYLLKMEERCPSSFRLSCLIIAISKAIIQIVIFELFCNKKSATNFKNHFMNILRWNKRALEITNQNNLLTKAFPLLANDIFCFSTDILATIMLQTIKDFINKHSNLSQKIIRVVVSKIRQVKTFTGIMTAHNL